MASAKRRMAPFSTSLSVGGEARPIAFLSSIIPLLTLTSGRKLEHREEPCFGGRQAWRGIHQRIRGGPVACHSPRDFQHQTRVRIDFNAVLRVVSPYGDGQFQSHPLL